MDEPQAASGHDTNVVDEDPDALVSWPDAVVAWPEGLVPRFRRV